MGSAKLVAVLTVFLWECTSAHHARVCSELSNTNVVRDRHVIRTQNAHVYRCTFTLICNIDPGGQIKDMQLLTKTWVKQDRWMIILAIYVEEQQLSY